MKIVAISTSPISLEQLHEDKVYVLFNSGSFYTYHNKELNTLAYQEPIYVFGIKNKEYLYVGECSSMDMAMEFFESGTWKNSKE